MGAHPPTPLATHRDGALPQRPKGSPILPGSSKGVSILLGMVPVSPPQCPQPPEGHATPPPTPDGAVAPVATRTPLTLPPQSPRSIPAPRGSPSGRSQPPLSRDGVPVPGCPRSPRSPAPLLGLWPRRVTRAGDRACCRHRTHLLFALSLRRGKDGGDTTTWHRHRLSHRPGPPAPRQGVLAPGHPAGNAARGAPAPRSPAPGWVSVTSRLAAPNPVTRRTPCPCPRVIPGSPQNCHGQENLPRAVCAEEGAGSGIWVKGGCRESSSPEPWGQLG